MCTLLVTFLLPLTVLGEGAVSSALGAACGDGVAPCRCDGLFVLSGVTLQISGAIRAQEHSVCFVNSGIILEEGATNVVITNGRIEGFVVGVAASSFVGRVTRSEFSRLQIVEGSSSASASI